MPNVGYHMPSMFALIWMIGKRVVAVFCMIGKMGNSVIGAIEKGRGRKAQA